jgi:putative ABC transport system substrate-binding protein
LKRRSVQSQAKNLIFPLDEYLSPSVVNFTFLYYRPRDTYRTMCAMRKAVLTIFYVVVLLAVAVIADAQQPARVPRIGILSPDNPVHSDAETLDAFRAGLRNLGYVEGKNINIEYRYAEWKFDRLPGLATELVNLKPDLIFTYTTPGALAAKQATTTIPVVIGAAGDLVQRGIVMTLARPGGNITGMTFPGSVEFFGKQLEILKEAAPKISRVALLVNPANPSYKAYPQNLEATAQALGLRLQRADANDPGDFEGVISKMVKSRADGLLVANDALFGAQKKRIAELALRKRLPTITQVPGFAEAGGLIQYGWDTRDMFRRAAIHVDKILKGTKPADLPVERPTKFELVINLKTAKQIGLTIPPNVLARADKVIK